MSSCRVRRASLVCLRRRPRRRPRVLRRPRPPSALVLLVAGPAQAVAHQVRACST